MEAVRDQRASPALVVVGVLCRDDQSFAWARDQVGEQLGAVVAVGGPWPFDFTDYYASESGTPLRRWFLSLEQPLADADLAGLKQRTGSLEARAAVELGPDLGLSRPINLDPGLLDDRRLVLASTKDRSQRIAIGQGMFAEITLLYRSGRYEPLPWTFSDFRSGRYEEFLSQERKRLLGSV